MASIECKAMVMREPNKPLVLETINVAAPKANEVRIKVLFSSVCHTDLLVLSGQDPETQVDPENGVILGHEAYGVVESVGEGVTDLKAGDYVIPAYIPECQECRFCKHPKTNLCQKIRVQQGQGVMPDGTSRYTDSKGRTLRHFMGISAFSQYVVCADISVVKCEENSLPFAEKLPIIGCGFTTGWGTVMKSGLEAGQSIAIIGLGGVGLAGIYAASKIGAKQIIAIDINPAKFELAKKLGATHCVNPKDHPDKLLSSVIMEMTEGNWGVDFAVECVGNVELMKQALHMTTKGWGKAIVVGVATGQNVESRSFYLVSGRTWSGAAFGSVKPKSELPQLVDDIITNKVNIDDFITGRRGLEGINETVDEMHSAGNLAIRTTIDMWQ